MKLQATLSADEYANLPENLLENYTTDDAENDGEYRLVVDGLEEVSGLKSAIEKERGNARRSHAKTKDLAEKLTEAEVKIEAGASSDELASLQKQHKRMTKTLEGLAKKQAIGEAIEAHQGFTALGAMYLDPVTQVEITDDGVRAFVEYEGQQLTLNEYAAELFRATDNKDHPLYDAELPRQFKSRVKGGGGTPPGSGGQAKVQSNDKPPSRSQMSTKDKVQFIKQHGEDAYMNLPG